MKLVRKLSLVIAMASLFPLATTARSQSIPRPEHPFPQMRRAEWMNLNGVWEFAETDESADAKYLSSNPYPDKINVPFCRESKLSGLARKEPLVKNVWYRRTFEAPKWKSQRVRLHIDASDWYTRVWINGKLVGDHKGGSASFVFDITDFLNPGKNTVVINAFDDTKSGLQALGKQSPGESQGCIYTRTTGIWQTVWLEGVGSSFISDCKIDTDPDNSRIFLQAEIDGPSKGLTFRAEAYSGKKKVGSAECAGDWRNNRCVIDLKEKRLWSIKDPFLYDLKLMLLKDGKVIDQVDSYFGLRKVSIHGAAILINDEAVFQRTILDQGFYPDGIWTAPSDEALRKDIELSMAAGFNGARLHQKVFEPRYLYWADKLGYLVWGEFPSWGLDYKKREIDLPVVNEWVEIIRRDRNHPSIIGWCPFNESWVESVPLQNVVVAMTRAIDPSRPIIDASGWVHGLPDLEVMDAHDYDQNPASFRSRWCDIFGPGEWIPERYKVTAEPKLMPYFVSEYGGIGWYPGEDGWSQGKLTSIDEFYTRYEGLTHALLDNRFMFGFCYTQLTDVEQERNGICYYNRKPKFDMDRLKKINSRVAAYEIDPPLQVDKTDERDWRVLVGAVPDGKLAKEWRYTTTTPSDNWMKPEFNDSAWKLGPGGFGKKEGWENLTGTAWTTDDIWLRQEFDYDGSRVNTAMLVIHFDNAVKVYVNGVEIWKADTWNDRYSGFMVTEQLVKALKPGKNVIAIHCSQDEGAQFIDAALLIKIN